MMVNGENGEVLSKTCFDFIQAFENAQDASVMSELQNLSCQHLTALVECLFSEVFWTTWLSWRISQSGSAMGFVSSLDMCFASFCSGYGHVWFTGQNKSVQGAETHLKVSAACRSRWTCGAGRAGSQYLHCEATAKLGLSRPLIGR